MLNSLYDSECDSSSISKSVTFLDKFVIILLINFLIMFNYSDHGNYSLNVSAWPLVSFFEFDTSKLKRKVNSFVEIKEKEYCIYDNIIYDICLFIIRLIISIEE